MGEAALMHDVQPLGELHDERQGNLGRRRGPATHGDVERLRRDVLVGEIRHPIGDAGAHGTDHRRVRHPHSDDLLERVAEEDRLLGGQIDMKGFERKETVAICRVATRQARAIHGTEDATPDLVYHAVRTEYTRSVIRAGTAERKGGAFLQVETGRYQEVHGFSIR